MFDLTAELVKNKNTFILDNPYFIYDFDDESINIEGKFSVMLYLSYGKSKITIRLDKNTCTDYLFEQVSQHEFYKNTQKYMYDHASIVYDDKGLIKAIGVHFND